MLTGPPSSGKTTLIRLLEERGFKTQAEVARAYIEEQLALGKRLHEVFADPASLQQIILMRGLEAERSLPHDIPHILDRSIVDGIAYCKLYGVAPDDILAAARERTYRLVFHCDPLPFQQDHVRPEDAKTALRIHELILEAYAETGYAGVRLPPVPVHERLAVLLGHLNLLDERGDPQK